MTKTHKYLPWTSHTTTRWAHLSHFKSQPIMGSSSNQPHLWMTSYSVSYHTWIYHIHHTAIATTSQKTVRWFIWVLIGHVSAPQSITERTRLSNRLSFVSRLIVCERQTVSSFQIILHAMLFTWHGVPTSQVIQRRWYHRSEVAEILYWGNLLLLYNQWCWFTAKKPACIQ